jgi:hypothetical protein
MPRIIEIQFAGSGNDPVVTGWRNATATASSPNPLLVGPANR